MKAAVLAKPGKIGEKPLRQADLARPEPSKDDVLLRVLACGVCLPTSAIV